jgi:diphosphomevalonate decarboxylase
MQQHHAGRVLAQAQPNIALVKYWGKRDLERNLPATGSLSVTLDALWTRMAVEFDPAAAADSLAVNGREAPDLLPRVSRCLDRVAGARRPRARVESESNFPVGAGLASSAAAFAALVVAASRAAGREDDPLTLARLAGAASGSAARSLFDGVVALEPGEDDITVESIAGSREWPLHVLVAITDRAAKPVGSGEAMRRCAETSPFYRYWVDRQSADLAAARSAVTHRDFAALAIVAEQSCLKMHSLMWTSRPPIVYWNDATVACMQAVRELAAGGCPVFFTIDAGPQVKAVCLPGEEARVRAALAAVPGVLEVLESGLGAGARVLEAA